MNSYYVYALLDPRKPGDYVYGQYHFDYEPFYIGKGKGNRIIQHLQEHSLNNPSNNFKSRVIRKIWNEQLNPILMKLHKNLSNSEALNLETELIPLIGRRDTNKGPLTNLTNGGEGTDGKICSKETKQLMSEQRKGKKQTEAQYIANCSRKQTEYQKKVTSERFKGKPQSNGLIQKRAESNRGQKRSKETKQLFSEQRKGKKQTAAQYSANLAKINNFQILSYENYKKWLLENNIKTSTQLKKFYKENETNSNIPRDPYNAYKKRKVWVSWKDLFN